LAPIFIASNKPAEDGEKLGFLNKTIPQLLNRIALLNNTINFPIIGWKTEFKQF
jgi:hypothetical protein